MEFYKFTKTDFKILLSLSGSNYRSKNDSKIKQKKMIATPFQNTCLKMLAIEYHETHQLNGYIDFKVNEKKVTIKEISFFKDDATYQVTEKFISHVSLLLESFIHYHETIYHKVDIRSALLIINDGYPSVEWF